MNNQSSPTGVIIGVLVVLVVIVIAFVAYNQGYFQGNTEDSSGVQIKLGGSN